MTPFSLGLLGAGRWGERYISTINELPHVELRQLYTTHPEKAQLVGHHVEVFADWRQLIKSNGCDAVIVATPPHTHAAIVRECLAANRPVLVEKPLCLSADEAVALHAEVERAKTPVLVGHTQLFNAAYEKLRELARDRGRVRFIISQGSGFGPFRRDTLPLWDWCPHDIAWSLDLMSEMPAGVTALGASPDPLQASNAEMLAIRLDFPSDARAWILAGCLSPIRARSLSVQFADSVLLLKDDDTGSSLFSYEVPFDARASLPSTFRLPPPVSVAVGPERPLARQVKYFVDGLQGGDRQRFGLRLAVEVVRTLDQAQRALHWQSGVAD
jgi:predicted dehydrogenase